MFDVWKVAKPLGLEIRPKNEKSWANSKICRVNFVQKVIDQSKFWQSQPIEDFFGVLATHLHARNMASKPTWALGHKRRDCANTILGPTVQTDFWAWRKKPSWTNQNGLMGACHRPYLCVGHKILSEPPRGVAWLALTGGVSSSRIPSLRITKDHIQAYPVPQPASPSGRREG